MMEKTCYLTRIKDEEKLIYYNLIYHYSLGIRRFYITLNNSNDETVQEIKRFIDDKKDAVVSMITNTDTSYTQPETFTQMSDMALDNGFQWHIPVDADELLVIKGKSLNDFLAQYNKHEYGFIRFPWVDYHPTDLDTHNDPNFFSRWEHRRDVPRGPSKIIAKWQKGCRYGDGHHLLVAKRNELATIPIEQGFYAHFVNRERDQIKNKRIRIGEAFVEKYGINSEKPQITEYKKWLDQGEAYFDQVWKDLKTKRAKLFKTLIHDPIDHGMFE